MNKEWAGKMDSPFFLGSPFQPKESKSLAQGPGCQPYAGLEPSMLAIPYAAFCAQRPQLGSLSAGDSACAQSPSTEVETILSHCYPSAH